MVLIHWEKSVKTASTTNPWGSKTTFLPIKLQQSIIQATMYAASVSNMVDIYETKGFDNFICSVVKTYVIPDILNYEGKLDDTRLKLVLFEFPTYCAL